MRGGTQCVGRFIKTTCSMLVSTLLDRICTEGCFFLDGHLITEGTRVSIPIYSIQRDPKIWGDDANEFRPERWNPDLGFS